MTAIADGGRYLERPRANGLADVVDIILDKGLVIDAFVRVSLLGLELLTIDARIVVASVDTYLRFAEAVDRVVLAPAPTTGIQDLLGGATEGTAKKSVEGGAEGIKEKAKDAKDSAKEAVGAGDDEGEGD
jgi:gas vesicle structural protein